MNKPSFISIITVLAIVMVSNSAIADHVGYEGSFEQVKFDKAECDLFSSGEMAIDFYLIPRNSRRLVIRIEKSVDGDFFDKRTFVTNYGYNKDFLVIEKIVGAQSTVYHVELSGVVNDRFSLTDFKVELYDAKKVKVCTGTATLFAK